MQLGNKLRLELLVHLEFIHADRKLALEPVDGLACHVTFTDDPFEALRGVPKSFATSVPMDPRLISRCNLNTELPKEKWIAPETPVLRKFAESVPLIIR